MTEELISTEGLDLVDGPHLLRFKKNLDSVYDATYVKNTKVATNNSFGIVKPDGITITVLNGVISGSNQYELPTATTTVLGGVKIDDDTIKINNGVISATAKNADYSSTEVLTGSKWLNNQPIHRITVALNTSVSCTADQWTEVCNAPNNLDFLIRGEYTDGSVSGCTLIKCDNNKIYINPSTTCDVRYVTLDYTKQTAHYMYDLTWAEAANSTWADFASTQWKGE